MCNPTSEFEYYMQNSLFISDLSISFRILLTVPVAIVSGEKFLQSLIKSYLRAIAIQRKLSNLVLLSIAHKLWENPANNIICDFAKIKSRNIKFIEKNIQ